MTKVLGRRAVLQAMGSGVGALAIAGCRGANVPGPAAAWATGGTAAMKGGYADPFAAGTGTTCKLTCSATIGPCYASTVTRKDISEGEPGLPVRLALLILDEQCKPIPNATVDIWHARGLPGCIPAMTASRCARWTIRRRSPRAGFAGSRRPTRRAASTSVPAFRAGTTAARSTFT